MNKKVPLVDLRHYTCGSAVEKKDFIRVMGEALQKFGFVILEGHGIDSQIIKNGYDQIKEFFSLPLESKMRYLDSSGLGQRGYISFGSENAKNSLQKDLKEFWHVGREFFERKELKSQYPTNVWPTEHVPLFQNTLLNLYGALDQLAYQLLCALAQYLNLPIDTLASMAKDGNTILRALHYPPLAAEQFQSGAVRSAPHEDINLITILCEATESGLQILTREGEWLEVECLAGQMVIDSGDMLARITNDVIPSTTHRVVNPVNSRNTARFSMPYFVHAYSDCELKIFDRCTSPLRPIKYPPILADEFLKQRLYEIGFNKK